MKCRCFPARSANTSPASVEETCRGVVAGPSLRHGEDRENCAVKTQQIRLAKANSSGQVACQIREATAR